MRITGPCPCRRSWRNVHRGRLHERGIHCARVRNPTCNCTAVGADVGSGRLWRGPAGDTHHNEHRITSARDHSGGDRGAHRYGRSGRGAYHHRKAGGTGCDGSRRDGLRCVRGRHNGRARGTSGSAHGHSACDHSAAASNAGGRSGFHHYRAAHYAPATGGGSGCAHDCAADNDRAAHCAAYNDRAAHCAAYNDRAAHDDRAGHDDGAAHHDHRTAHDDRAGHDDGASRRCVWPL